MGAKYTEAQAKASKAYTDKLDRITIRAEKGKKDEWRKNGEARGYESLNKYIIALLEADAENV